MSLLLAGAAAGLWGQQTVKPGAPGAPKAAVKRADAPGPNEILVTAVSQEADGVWRRLRGQARLETSEVLLAADEVDYNAETGYVEARGNVRFEHLDGGEEVHADRVEYSLREETATYYNVRGWAKPKIEQRAGLLVSPNPFYFQGLWAERIKRRYILHDGFVTNCKLPRPIWVLKGSRFDIIPNERAIARNAVFRLSKVPLFFTPYFYKSLESRPRKSGFLTPNAGNSSRRGKMLGVGYYWALNRSYDTTYRMQYFTQRGFAHHVDVRGKPTSGSEFNALVYGVNDRGLQLDGGQRRKEGGAMVSFEGRAELPWGFYSRGEVNYLSSFQFRQAFSESFYEAIFSQLQSVGFVSKHWSGYNLHLVFARNEIFQSTLPGDTIVVRKLPQVEFSSRDRLLAQRVLPVWISLESAAGLVRRTQPLFQTRQFVERADFAPRLTTALRWKGFSLLPSLAVRETYYGSSRQGGRIAGENLLRSSREFSADLIAPSLARTFGSPRWLGTRLKHVIEPRVSFRYVTGLTDFDRVIRFDDLDLATNTEEAEVSLTNRIFAKRKTGLVQEVLSWQVWHKRYFDPTFGGAVVEGQRNVVASTAQLTGYAFLDGPRRYSPLVSALRASPTPWMGIFWRADYDPARRRFTNSSLMADARWGKYFLSAGHSHVRSVRQLTPSANQFQGIFGLGQTDKPGWGAAFSAVYDFRTGVMQFATTQVTYNTDCCGFSVQYRRFGFGTRNENQFRLAFVIANIGSFGTLRRQERLF